MKGLTEVTISDIDPECEYWFDGFNFTKCWYSILFGYFVV
jgi:hypothetical protein